MCIHAVNERFAKNEIICVVYFFLTPCSDAHILKKVRKVFDAFAFFYEIE